jgi:hypothetical protein
MLYSMSDLPVYGEPTHILHVTVPLRLNADERTPDFDAVSEALQLVMALTRSAYRGYICGDAIAEMEKQPEEAVTELMRVARPYDWASASDDHVEEQPQKDHDAQADQAPEQ